MGIYYVEERVCWVSLKEREERREGRKLSSKKGKRKEEMEAECCLPFIRPHHLKSQ